MNLLSNYRPDTKLWIYAFSRRLDAGEVTLVYSVLKNFVDEWKSHQHDVRGAFEIVHDQFVLMAAESDNGISGCSIDSSVAVFKWLKAQNNLDALDRSFVFYRDGDVVRTTTRSEFQELVDAGKVISTPEYSITRLPRSAIFTPASGKCRFRRAGMRRRLAGRRRR